MGQTLSEQILSHAAGHDAVPGEIVVLEPDVIMGHDSLSPGILEIMREEEVLRTDIPVDDALKMIVSAGRVSLHKVNARITNSQNGAVRTDAVGVSEVVPPPSNEDAD